MKKYSDFAMSTCNKFKEIQEKFVEKYNLNDFTEWFYDEETSLITFKKGQTELNFEYIPIGSYSNSSKTWLWAWNNKELLHNNKLKTILIKQFGKENNYSRLTQASFDADKNIGWELTAIAYDLIKAIGSYRIINEDNLEIYFLLTDEIDNNFVEELKKINKNKTKKLIQCKKHGFSRPAFICQHLNENDKTGFEEAFETEIGMHLEEDDDLSAWCNKCEEARIKDDGWNQKNMKIAKIKLACEQCYFKIKETNNK
ncbi:DUF6882 domain-containing protein [Flavobacterium sp. 140616W15]|uniref:DUF6882 domain-containing protein n=1 Tax=Flavobacterium sp. 140616W15 TaxID=2478552 RepID=UPI000F0C4A2B|nr:DUF6882 domain-containing protein [Flavobacterium sp. 140616W15]AYN04615.1 hypothetical protein EAG11_10920 [Flavobacterium sp. 140616W15]